MYTEIRMITEGRYPCLEMNVSLLAWNEWMQDSLAKTAVRDRVIEEEGKIPVFASKALGISSKGLNRIIVEVTA